jgi:hypothetical protein
MVIAIALMGCKIYQNQKNTMTRIDPLIKGQQKHEVVLKKTSVTAAQAKGSITNYSEQKSQKFDDMMTKVYNNTDYQLDRVSSKRHQIVIKKINDDKRGTK